MVYVLSIDNEPLMPCSNVIARLLLKQGKAKVKYREPFTIKLTYETTTYTQALTLGVDTGSQTFATAVADEKGNILYTSEVTLREDMNNSLKRKWINDVCIVAIDVAVRHVIVKHGSTIVKTQNVKSVLVQQ